MTQQHKIQAFSNIFLSDDRSAVVILDQSLLPAETVYQTLRERDEMFDAICQLRVRGAPAIGIFAAFCMYVLAQSMAGQDRDEFQAQFDAAAAYLESSRPTAVNLHWALERMRRTVRENGTLPFAPLLEKLRAEAEAIQQEDAVMCQAISENGLRFLKSGDGVLTYCNAGPMACSRYGTAQGALILAKERGMDLRVFACETRPLLQGARLTSYELHRAGLDVTLICDNMASIVMKNGWVNACYVGCDRIAANGDTANKIGTSGVAILAKHYGIPFYVLGPTSTIDLRCSSGMDIHIEERPQSEIREKYYARPMVLPDVKCYNPSFDVTDHELITAIITEKGVCLPPFSTSLRKLMEG